MKNNPPHAKAVYSVLALLTLIGIAIVVRRTLTLVPTLAHGYQPAPPAANPQLQALITLDDLFARYALLTLTHILPGLLFILSGPWQFIASWRIKYPRWSLLMRKVFFISGALTGITAMVMSIAMPAIGGINQATATTLFSLLFLFFLLRAFRSLQTGQPALYREWLIRAYAIGLAITTIRPIIGIFFATRRLTGLEPATFFGIAFWLGFVIHLIIAEAWINATRARYFA